MSMSKELFLQERETESLLASNKDFRTAKAQAVVLEVAQGERDATKTLITAKKAIEFFTLIENNVKPYVAGKQIQKGGLTLYDAVIVQKSDPSKYDYSVCNDSKLNAMYAELEALKEKIKVRESFLKALPEPMADPETGEIINPPDKITGKENISITLK